MIGGEPGFEEDEHAEFGGFAVRWGFDGGDLGEGLASGDVLCNLVVVVEDLGVRSGGVGAGGERFAGQSEGDGGGEGEVGCYSVEDFGWEVGERAIGLWVDGAVCVDLGGVLEVWEWEKGLEG